MEVAAIGIHHIEVEGAPVIIVAARRVTRRNKDNSSIGQVSREEIIIRAILLLIQKVCGVGDGKGAVGKGQLTETTAININFIEPPAGVCGVGRQGGGASKDQFGTVEIHIGRLDINQPRCVIDKE